MRCTTTYVLTAFVCTGALFAQDKSALTNGGLRTDPKTAGGISDRGSPCSDEQTSGVIMDLGVPGDEYMYAGSAYGSRLVPKSEIGLTSSNIANDGAHFAFTIDGTIESTSGKFTFGSSSSRRSESTFTDRIPNAAASVVEPLPPIGRLLPLGTLSDLYGDSSAATDSVWESASADLLAAIEAIRPLTRMEHEKLRGLERRKKGRDRFNVRLNLLRVIIER
jgi:hypothetical protein